VQHQAKLSSKGQITIPREVRQALRLRQGDTVVFEVDEGGVRLRPGHPSTVFQQYAGILRSGQGQTVKEIVAEVRRQRGHTEA